MKSKKLLKKGGNGQIFGNILIQKNIEVSDITDLYKRITEILTSNKGDTIDDIKDDSGVSVDNVSKMINFLDTLSTPKNIIFDDIASIVKTYDDTKGREINFQSRIFDGNDIFVNHKLWNKEEQRKFITIDPTIVQIMIFDDQDINDIVYSLKLIIRARGKLYLRYTTQLFPDNSKIDSFNDLLKFGKFNKSLGDDYIKNNYDEQLTEFLKKYIKFYNFYRKCYTIDEQGDAKKHTKKLIDYQLKYISILGKARFGFANIINRTALLTDYVMSNLIFTSPTYAFISGGYKGFKSNKYGITRSGYEIAKKYNRPILTIMCKEGMVDAHEYSDATLIYGEHWGEDTIALSQLTDGAIVIAPFGGWTYIECLALLANKKIVGIYNDLFNILNYEAPKDLTTDEFRELIIEFKKVLPNLSEEEIIKQINQKNNNKTNNKNFFNFFTTEQNSIIDYYINYYLILLYIIIQSTRIIDKDEFIKCLTLGIQILMYLKTLFPSQKKIFDDNKDLTYFTDEFILLIRSFNELKTSINTQVNNNLNNINDTYLSKCSSDIYQRKIPEKCDGIWIKPVFNLIDKCIKNTTPGGRKNKKGGTCDVDKTIIININKYKIDYGQLNTHNIFENLNNNIIFVFSDVMYLNMYLNANLNTTSFQEVLYEKINNLSEIKITYKDSRTSSMRDLTEEEAKILISLNRNIDGMYNTEQGKIINDTIIREKYSFIINESCNEYTSMLLPVLNKQTTEPVTLAETKQSKKQSKQSKQSKK